jgi:hypothetical protein
MTHHDDLKVRLETLKAEHLELCKEYDSMQQAADPVNVIIDLLNIVLDQQDEREEDERFLPKYRRHILYSTSALVGFLTSLHEKTEQISGLEVKLKKSDLESININAIFKAKDEEIESLKKKIKAFEMNAA